VAWARSTERSLWRDFTTPEGVRMRLQLASAGERAGAFLIDIIIIGVIMVASAIVLGLIASAFEASLDETLGNAVIIVWMLAAFVLRNAWFTLFEMTGRGATPGKRLMAVRVVARDGARLTGGAVIVRNAMREIEVFLPLSFLAINSSTSTVDGAVYLLGFTWVAVFLFFPLFNSDRLRVGDLLAGTWVVHSVRATLAPDLVGGTQERARRVFSDAALDLYGIFELQTLEEVLRRGNEHAVATVAASIRNKAGLDYDGDDAEFLSDYYLALCVRLERNAILGRRRADKHSQA
jgi:uncharacterized RDD family membrane protein YckC